MSDLSKNILTVVATIVIIGIISNSDFLRWLIPTGGNAVSQVEVSRDTIVVSDTTIVQDTLNFSLKSKKDTAFLPEVKAKVEVATADTTIDRDSTKIFVKYFSNPINKFEIKIKSLKKMITKIEKVEALNTVTVEVSEPLYRNTWFYIALSELVLLFMLIMK